MKLLVISLADRLRHDLTHGAEPSVDVLRPGRQASWIRPPTRTRWLLRRNPRCGHRPGRPAVHHYARTGGQTQLASSAGHIVEAAAGSVSGRYSGAEGNPRRPVRANQRIRLDHPESGERCWGPPHTSATAAGHDPALVPGRCPQPGLVHGTARPSAMTPMAALSRWGRCGWPAHLGHPGCRAEGRQR